MVARDSCSLCDATQGDLLWSGAEVVAFWAAEPRSAGRVVLAPRRHVGSWNDASPTERSELVAGLEAARSAIAKGQGECGFLLAVRTTAVGGLAHLHAELMARPLGGEAPASYSPLGEDPLWVELASDALPDSTLSLALPPEEWARGGTLARLHLLLEHRAAPRIVLWDPTTDDPTSICATGAKVKVVRRPTSGGSVPPPRWLAIGAEVAYVEASEREAGAHGSWVYRLDDPAAVGAARSEFESLWAHPAAIALEAPNVTALPLGRRTPHVIQREALEALDRVRREGNTAALVVLATGLGKTSLAAFDARAGGFGRVLFVAHREELLTQARATFAEIFPGKRSGLYVGAERDLDADMVFASVQTLSRAEHLQKLDPERFDYVIVDEFHHASASSYRRVLDRVRPRFLLGLTATPERTDGGDLLSLCGDVLAYRCDLGRGIGEGLLCPFRYFGVADPVDYAPIPWRSSRFDEEALTAALVNDARTSHVLAQHARLAGARTLAFCASQRHASAMAAAFRAAGVAAAAVHSGPGAMDRAAALDALRRGELRVLFAVDLFNEGVDVPAIDTVMMLRPTESRIVFLQQLGRGLRLSPEKQSLTVIDYIGNHRSFLTKAQALLSLDPGDAPLAEALSHARRGQLAAPPACTIDYDLRAIEAMERLLRPAPAVEQIEAWYAQFKELHGVRPTASEAVQEGQDPRELRRRHRSWLRFVDAQSDLSPPERRALAESEALLDSLERTPMTRSYKMLVLRAMLREGSLAAPVGIDVLTDAAATLARRSPALRRDLGEALGSTAALRMLLEEHPLAALASSDGLGGPPHFAYQGGTLRCLVSSSEPEALAALARELVDYRLLQYLRLADGAAEGAPLQLHRRYLRAEIPALFGASFSKSRWEQGFVRDAGQFFLLVTLEKGDLPEEHAYADRFLGDRVFEWQSQNRMSRTHETSRALAGHQKANVPVHLFVRRSKLVNGKGAPFVYLGQVAFRDWERDNPITVRFELGQPVPRALWDELRIGPDAASP